MADEIEIRRARHDDVDAVLALWAHSRSGHASVPDRREAIERLIDDSPAALLIAEHAGLIVGAVIAAWDGWRGNIYRLAVDGRYRRRSIGLQLIRAAEQYLHARGARRITALVAYDDPAAASFWEAAGYPKDLQIGRRVRNL